MVCEIRTSCLPLASRIERKAMIVQLFTTIASYADFTTVFLFVVVSYLTWKISTGYNLPPGPIGLPIVGYLPFMGSGPAEETFYKLGKKYGPLISFYFGSTLHVVLNNHEIIKECFSKQGDNFAGRPHAFQPRVQKDDAGIGVSEGEPWREQRRFVISTLRDYGMGKLSLEPRIMEEIHYYLDVLAKENGRSVDISHMMSLSTANVISLLEFGKRFEYNDPRYIRLCELQHEQLRLSSHFDITFYVPWLEYLPFIDRITNIKRIRDIDGESKSILYALVDEHKRDYHEDSQKDLIDSFITERNSLIKKTGQQGSFSAKDLQGNLLGLFQGGTEATTATVRWGLLYMITYPEMQKKVHKEIDDVVGMERDVAMADKTRMVYTDAVLLEISRFGSIAALGVPHANIEETEVSGYRIPKRTTVLSNIWAVHFDPQIWDEPEKFNPERFISKEGKIYNTENLIPFGIGKRACAGESLAKMQNFLYFVSMLQRFEFKAPEGAPLSLGFESTVARRPLPYKLRAIQRPGYHL